MTLQLDKFNSQLKSASIMGALFLCTSVYAHVDEQVLLDFEKRCMICHDSYKQNDFAPPVIAVQQIYHRKYKMDLVVAKNAMMSFLEKPTHEKALMKPAIKLYGLMPQQQLTPEERLNFSEVILETPFEIPDWFEGHFQSHKLNLDHEDKTLQDIP